MTVFAQVALPYAKDALAPHVSVETIDFHYGKHHATYVTNLNNLAKGTEFENLSLEEVVKKAPAGPIFNNAAQIWNHDFFIFWVSSRLVLVEAESLQVSWLQPSTSNLVRSKSLRNNSMPRRQARLGRAGHGFARRLMAHCRWKAPAMPPHRSRRG